MWLHARLEEVHGEDPLTDYMRKLRSIIEATPDDQITPNTTLANNLTEITRKDEQ